MKGDSVEDDLQEFSQDFVEYDPADIEAWD